MPAWIPDGFHTLTPRLVADDASTLVSFLKDAFGASGDLPTEGPAQLRIGDSLVMVSESGPRPATEAFLYLYVEDVDATYRRAIAAGAMSLEAPDDMAYGDRRAMVRDPGGNVWQIATFRKTRESART
jgi:PhnB protein